MFYIKTYTTHQTISVLPNLSTRVRAFNSVLVNFRAVKDDYKHLINILFTVI